MKPIAVFALIATLTTSLLATPLDKIKLIPNAKEGASVKHYWELKFSAGGNDVLLASNVESKVKSVETGMVSLTRNWTDLKLDVGGQSPNVEVEEMLVKAKPDGELLEISGGIAGSDPIRSLLPLTFFSPVDGVAVGETYKREFKANDKGLPAISVEVTYQADEDVDGQKLHKLVSKLTESGSGGLTCETTFWLTDDAEIVKAESKFKNFPIPAMGLSVDGTTTLKRTK